MNRGRNYDSFIGTTANSISVSRLTHNRQNDIIQCVDNEFNSEIQQLNGINGEDPTSQLSNYDMSINFN